MARELIIRMWCDGFARPIPHTPKTVEAVLTRTIAVDGKSREIDVCEDCDASVVALARFLEEVGRSPEPLTGEAPSTPKTSRMETEDMRTCPECWGTAKPYIGKTRAALTTHLKSKHGRKMRDYEWPFEPPSSLTYDNTPVD